MPKACKTIRKKKNDNVKKRIANLYVFLPPQLGSWLAVFCERSENRGSGGGGSCLTGSKIGQIGGDSGEPEGAF